VACCWAAARRAWKTPASSADVGPDWATVRALLVSVSTVSCGGVMYNDERCVDGRVCSLTTWERTTRVER